jgi:carbon monoxide dehydrogenase subunit G
LDEERKVREKMQREYVPKFKLGQEVDIGFIGRIVKIEVQRDEVRDEEHLTYTVEGSGARRIFAYMVPESSIHALPGPEDFKKL